MADRRLRQSVAFAYGLFAYAFALATVAYAVGFLANVAVPKSIDSGVTHSFGDPLTMNLSLIALFGLQHSLMARPRFKAWWTRIVPEPIERSTYVLFASTMFVVLMWGWRPMPDVVWTVERPIAHLLWSIYLSGWILMFVSTNMIDGDDLVGLRQVKAYRDGREISPIDFQTPSPYRYIRNPIMAGFLVAFWITPQMSVGHLLFAGGMTAYIFVGVKLEERNLFDAYGDQFRRYHDEVPRFIPRPGRFISTDANEMDGE